MNFLLKNVTLVMFVMLKVLTEICHTCHDYLVEGIGRSVSFLL